MWKKDSTMKLGKKLGRSLKICLRKTEPYLHRREEQINIHRNKITYLSEKVGIFFPIISLLILMYNTVNSLY